MNAKRNANNTQQSRREFLKNARLVLGSSLFSLRAASTMGLGALSACASLDESIIDTNHTERSVAIIGAGIGGLSLSYFLKNQKQQFVLFEASQRVGGRIYRADGNEWGAYEFFQTDESLKKIMKSLNLNPYPLDRDTWTFENGSDEFLNGLSNKSFGLLEHRSLKLRHQLIRITKTGQSFRLFFKTPKGIVNHEFSHVVICLPGNQFETIQGLDDFSSSLTVLPTLKKGEILHAVRLIKPPLYSSQNRRRDKGVLTTEYNDDRIISVRFSKNKTYFTLLSTDRKPLRDLNEIQKVISKNYSSFFNRTQLAASTESIMDWSSKEFIRSGYFQIDYKSDLGTSFYDGRSSLHLVSDSFGVGLGRVESVVKLSQKTANILSLYN
jgi:hypothetical protein